MTTNLFQELKDILQEFKDFLDANVGDIAPAVSALASLVPQINELIDKLIDLMNKLKTEIQNLDVGAIANLDKVSEFTTKISTFLNAAKGLLPDEADEIDSVLEVADVISSLPTIDQVKGEILALIDAINGHLATLKAA